MVVFKKPYDKSDRSSDLSVFGPSFTHREYKDMCDLKSLIARHNINPNLCPDFSQHPDTPLSPFDEFTDLLHAGVSHKNNLQRLYSSNSRISSIFPTFDHFANGFSSLTDEQISYLFPSNQPASEPVSQPASQPVSQSSSNSQ